MKIVILSCLATLALAAPQNFDQQRPIVQILRDERVDNGDGNFNYIFAADNGIEIEVLGAPGSNGQSNMQGYFMLFDDAGNPSRIDFVADENGYQPSGALIPAVPAHVQELLAIAAEQRASGVQFDEQGFRLNK